MLYLSQGGYKMNYFELIVYSNIAISVLLIIIIAVLLSNTKKLSDEVYNTKRVLQDIYNKLDKNK